MCDLRLDEEPHLYLWKERIAFTIVRPRLKLQCPDHLAVGMVGQIVKYLLERGTLWGLPVGDTAIAIGYSCEWGGGTERTYKGERNSHVARWKPGGEVEDVACYAVFGQGGWEGRGRGWGRQSGVLHHELGKVGMCNVSAHGDVETLLCLTCLASRRLTVAWAGR